MYRREFLWNVCAGALLLGMPGWGCKRAKLQAVTPRQVVESWQNSVCQLCPSGCGMRVRVVDGKPVTVKGNPLHPVNRGGLCARGGASLQLYYDPDRFEGPLRRDPTSVRGWSPVPWDAGLDEVIGHLEKSLAYGPGRVAVLRGDGRDLGSQLLGRLVRATGSPWVVDALSPGERAADETVLLMHGVRGRLVYDLAHADFLFSFDSGLLESPSSTMTLHRDFADMRAAGATFVHAAPRMGVTGSKADVWLPARPSSAGALALGIAHMLIKEGYARDEFVGDHASGFDDWTDEADVRHIGVRSWILREFAPERVAGWTGLEWGDIIRVARQFGSAQRPLAVGPIEAAAGVTTFDLLAVHTLNVIVGAIDVPGGVLLARQPPFERLDALSDGEGAFHDGDRLPPSIDEFADFVLDGESVPIDVAFVHEADPVFTSARGDKVEKALRRIPFVVSTSPVMTDTAQAADLALPASLWLERRCDSIGVDRGAYPVVSLSPPAAASRCDTRNIADVALAIAHRLGGSVAKRFSWTSYDDLVRDRVDDLFRSGVGDTFAESHRSAWMQMLERSGWRAPSYQTAVELERDMEQHGGWWDPVYHSGEWRRLVPGVDHRVNLEPVRAAFRPRAWEMPEHAKDATLSLYVYPELVLTTRTSGSLPFLQDLGSPLWQKSWETSAELNPRTAERLGVVHGDAITITNERGELKAVAVLSEAIRPDVVAVHTGGGRTYAGRYAAHIGHNPLRLLAVSDEHDGGRSMPALTTVRVATIV